MLSRSWTLINLTLLVSFSLILAGCSEKTAEQKKYPGENKNAQKENEHDHSHEGPHHGHVLELGHDHELHGELVEDHDSESLKIYLLDHDMKVQPITEDHTAKINLTVDGKPVSYDLKKAEDDKKEAYFTSDDKALFEAFEHEKGLKGRLTVTVKGEEHHADIEHEPHGEHDHNDEKNKKEKTESK